MLYAAFRYMDRRCFGADHDEDDDSDHSEYLILEGRRREGRPESPLWVTVDFQDETGSSRVDGDDEERLAWNHHETVRIGEGLTRSGMV
ncbi:MAG: hypothetical protein M4579_006211 [Chaenotheca gracillima]|nr:MAG: hypothetical protein M4579_006211 [Chaenotheca gracillima]